MTVADTLRSVGRPIAYYPVLAKRLGGVNAAVLFCQLFYWQDKAESPLGVHKTRDELELETGLSHEEQATARRHLKKRGVLVETTKRIDHKVYFRIDETALEALLAADPSETVNHGLGKPETPVSGNRKSRLGETVKTGSGKPGKTASRNRKPRSREAGDHGFVNGTETTTKTTKKSSSNAREKRPVDKSAAAAIQKNPTPEQSMLALLAALPRCAIDPVKDRILVLMWVGRSVSAAVLDEAARRAVAARERDTDDRPVYAAFLAKFIDEVLAGGASTPAPFRSPEWWLGGTSDIEAAAAAQNVPTKRGEPTPDLLVRVAAASGKGPWIDHVLREGRKGNDQRYQRIVEFYRELDLLPVDF